MMRTTVSTQPQIIIVACCITLRRSAYGAWGNYSVHGADGKKTTDATFIGHINPLRYRGYYYDRETRLYYLQSRYYDFANCRFINADTFATTDANGFLSANMFAYCENNPIMRTDESGEFWNIVIGAAVGGVTEIASQMIAGTKLKDVNWLKVGVSAACGALDAVVPAGVSAVVSGVTTFLGDLNEGASVKDALIDTAGSVAGSLIGTGATHIGGRIKFTQFKQTATKRELKNLGSKMAGKHSNSYKNLANWNNKKALKYFSGSTYARYLGFLGGGGFSISFSIFRSRR